MNVILSEYGKSFATRPRGAEVASLLVDGINSRGDSHLMVNFEGVSVVSGSFADEFIRRLASNARTTQICFSGMNADVAARIRWAIDHSRKISERQKDNRRLPELVA